MSTVHTHCASMRYCKPTGLYCTPEHSAYTLYSISDSKIMNTNLNSFYLDSL